MLQQPAVLYKNIESQFAELCEQTFTKTKRNSASFYNVATLYHVLFTLRTSLLYKL